MQLDLARIPVTTPAYDTNLSPELILQCKDLFFRQSFVQDYLSCPMMALYRWVLSMEESEPWFAGILGSAGHAVIYTMHELHKFDYSYPELMGMFEEEFNKEISKQDQLPALSVKFDSLEEEFSVKAPDYVRFLRGYQEHPKNQEFHSTLHEQNFVLVIPRDSGQARSSGDAGQVSSSQQVSEHLSDHGNVNTGGIGSPSGHDSPIIFTGIIDQLGYYSDGTLAIRDTKFRDSAFRPGRTELAINNQLTVYSAALKYGIPSCLQCKPSYQTDDLTGAKLNLSYKGPCDKCLELYNSRLWPKRHPDVVQLIWMRDFDRRTKNEFTKFIPDPDKVKERNPETGRMKIREIINPKFHEGYMIGDYCGPGFLSSYREESKTEVLMTDIINACESIRDAKFYRKPSSHCNFMCKYREHCVDAVETKIHEIDMSKVSQYATYNPFGE